MRDNSEFPFLLFGVVIRLPRKCCGVNLGLVLTTAGQPKMLQSTSFYKARVLQGTNFTRLEFYKACEIQGPRNTSLQNTRPSKYKLAIILIDFCKPYKTRAGQSWTNLVKLNMSNYTEMAGKRNN